MVFSKCQKVDCSEENFDITESFLNFENHNFFGICMVSKGEHYEFVR
jgi:hypothetical protein